MLLTFCCLPAMLAQSESVDEIAVVKNEDTAAHRWLEKKVLASRLLDDMETPAKWTLNDSELYKPKNPGTVGYTRERAESGAQSLRLTGTARGAKVNSRDFGSVGVVREFDREDWSDFNRISIRVYPQLPGFQTVTLAIALHNDGEEKLAGTADKRERVNFVQLKNNSWNEIVWEIPELPRDKVTGLEFLYRMQGTPTEASDKISFDFDRLELQCVEADYFEGWEVAPDRIAYSHSGYQPDSRKTALSSNLAVKTFSVVNQKTGKIVLTKLIENAPNRFGAMQLMDFSEIKQSGEYFIKAGNISTRPFRIAGDVWNSSVWKTLNFYRAERCGVAVAGVHAACHFDVRSVDGEKSLVVNGGWHDAGDASLGLVKNAESVYAMLSLAEKLRGRGDDPKLISALTDEAKWGLKWILKTSFHDGKRAVWTTMARWTNNIVGDADDVASKASNNPFANFHAAAAEALAARVLQKTDAEIARESFNGAKEDWKFAVAGMNTVKSARGDEENPANSPLETASIGVLASLELYKATNEEIYADKALELSATIVNSQKQTYTDWETPLAGFFYTDTQKTKLVHYDHLGRDQAAIIALAELCKTFPRNENWMKWYAGIALYSEYLKTISQYTAPYNFLPNGVYRDDEYLQVPERQRESYKKQIANGVKLDEHNRLRIFPVWFDFRGVYGPLLARAKALSAAADLRGDEESFQLAEQQAQWIVGRNPFAQSTMYGEGYDFAPVFSPMSGNLVGGLPGGVMTRGDADTPYFPNSAMTNYKEIGTHRSARWLWLLSDLYRPASKIEKLNTSASQLKFNAAATTNINKTVTITIAASGTGKHRFELRADNLKLERQEREIVFNSRKTQTLIWKARVENPGAPWFIVAVPDNDINRRKEIFGINYKK